MGLKLTVDPNKLENLDYKPYGKHLLMSRLLGTIYSIDVEKYSTIIEGSITILFAIVNLLYMWKLMFDRVAWVTTISCFIC